MILTGNEIIKNVEKGKIVIEQFNVNNIEPNSYGFHLGNQLLVHNGKDIFDVHKMTEYTEIRIDERGFVFEPNTFYLGVTNEKMGSKYFAQTLHASFSTSAMGMWIQFSAPLGHTGSIINWTLEIMVTHKIKIYPNMKIGKIAFWKNHGRIMHYFGRYKKSTVPVASKINQDYLQEIIV